MSKHPTRRTVLATGLAVAVSPLRAVLASGPTATSTEGMALPAAGINLAGADFGKIPGTHGKEYIYPGRKHVAYYRDLGFRLIRLPFKWERLQPELNEPFAAQESSLLTETVAGVTGAGLQTILDPHNYAKRRISGDGWSKEHRIGSDAVPADAFFDFWVRLARMFAADDRVIFGLMNEPVGIDARAWLPIVNGTIAAIRAAGAKNLILVPGVEYSGAHSWFAVGNDAMAGVVDPADRYAFDVHQYFDGNSSGTRPEAVSGTIGSERIEAFQEWARAHGFKAILGEFCGGRNQPSYNALHDICQEMSANTDVWLGWAAWAGGPRWPENDMFNLEPWRDGRIREQTRILAHYAKPPSADYWVAPGAAIDLDLARDRLFGAETFAAALAAAGALPRTRKGLRLDARETTGSSLAGGNAEAGIINVAGPLLALLQQPAFTLVIQTRELPAGPVACDILHTVDTVLLRRTEDGALETNSGATLRTAAQPLRNWRAKRRLAIAIRRQGGRVAIGATGARAVEAEAAPPAIVEAILGGAGAAGASGYVTRITGYPEFLDSAALDALTA